MKVETLGIRKLPTPKIELVKIADLIIADGKNGTTESGGTLQRKKLYTKVEELLAILQGGFELLPIMVARIDGTRLLVMDGGQRTRAYRAYGKIKSCLAIIYDFKKEDEQLLRQLFFAMNNSSRVSSAHTAMHWPGPAQKYVHAGAIAANGKQRPGRSPGILARGLLVALEGGVASKGGKPTLQQVDQHISDAPERTDKTLRTFLQAVEKVFPASSRIELNAMLAVAQVFHKNYPGLRPMPSVKVTRIDWDNIGAKAGRTLFGVPAWVSRVERAW